MTVKLLIAKSWKFGQVPDADIWFFINNMNNFIVSQEMPIYNLWDFDI